MMPSGRVVPKATVFRLSLYLRQLDVLSRRGRETVSSRELGQALSLTDAQVRKDLAHFGQFGYRGVGYKVNELAEQLRRILGTDHKWNVVVLGAGNLGQALSAYKGFKNQGFDIVGVFDSDVTKVGHEAGGLIIQSMETLPEAVSRLDVKIALLCVPADAAQKVADEARRAGVRGLFNFAPVTLDLPEGVVLVSEDLAIRLEQLSFELTQLHG